LRRFHPTIAVRSLNEKVLETKKKSRALQGQKKIYERAQELTGLRDNGNVDALRHFLDAYSATRDELTYVALVGYPNVGKSTLFNSIKKRAIANVDKLPSTTKAALEAQYNDKLVVVDCPPLDVDYSAESSIVLRHGIAAVWLEDPVPVVRELLERGDGMNLMQHLQIPLFKSHEDFLAKLAVKKNLIRKGGDPDILQTARGFLRDLGNGTYATSCLPPVKSKSRFDMPEWFTSLSLPKVRFCPRCCDPLCQEVC
jgi:nuclear GTP-binding protein